jgi:RNA polymerase sigma-70 factor (ECF subfamily)
MKRRKTYSLSDLSYDDKEYDIPVIKDPSSSLEKRNIGKSIQIALNELPADFKTMIILRDIQELSYEDISRIVGVPIGTVKSRINRGRLKLQNLLKKIGGR